MHTGARLPAITARDTLRRALPSPSLSGRPSGMGKHLQVRCTCGLCARRGSLLCPSRPPLCRERSVHTTTERPSVEADELAFEVHLSPPRCSLDAVWVGNLFGSSVLQAPGGPDTAGTRTDPLNSQIGRSSGNAGE